MPVLRRATPKRAKQVEGEAVPTPSRSFEFCRILICAAAASVVAGCDPQGGTSANSDLQRMPSESRVALPLGDLAGAAQDLNALSVANPLEQDVQAATQGKQLFIAMNCAS